jgi:hypothetical protein
VKSLGPTHPWAKTNMTRTHGWNRRGEALIAKAPQGHWKTMTFLAALRCDEITAPFVLDGPINGECFKTYEPDSKDNYRASRLTAIWMQASVTKAARVRPRFS